MIHARQLKQYQNGFTIAEIIVVIVVIGILASISIVGYGAWRQSTITAQLKSDLSGVTSSMEDYRNFNNIYPQAVPSTIAASKNVSLSGGGSVDGSYFCVEAVSSENPSLTYYIDSRVGKEPQVGTCPSSTSTPGGPPGLAITSTTDSQVNVSWPLVAQATSYRVQCATDTAFVLNLREKVTTTLATSLGSFPSSSTIYCKFQSISGTQSSDWSARVQGLTATTVPQVVPPNTPSWTIAQTQTPTSILFAWEAVTGVSTYTIQSATNAGFTANLVASSQAGTDTDYQPTNLTPGTMYYFRVRADSVSNGSSGWTTAASATTSTLAAPTTSVSVVSSSSFYQSWNSVPYATNYTFQCSNDGTTWTVGCQGTLNATSYTYTGATPETLYYVRVRAELGSYYSAWSNVPSITTPTPIIAMSSPVECAGTYSGRSAFQVRLYMSEVSYNYSANTSNVSWQLYRYAAAGGWATYDQTTTWPWYVTVTALQGWSGSSNSIYFKTHTAAGATEGISSGSLTVSHDASGNSSIGYSGQDGPGSSIFGTASCSGTYVLSDLRP